MSKKLRGLPAARMGTPPTAGVVDNGALEK
jgi:hypothetical protein